jgi:hypothetical protein
MTIATYNADGFDDAGVDLYGLRELRFSTNVAEAMRIDSSGNVNVGGTANFGLFTVTQSTDTNAGGIGVVDSGNAKSGRLWSNGTNIYLSSGATGTGNLVLNEGGGNVGIGTSTITNPYSQTPFTDVNINGTWGGAISFQLGGVTKGWVGQRSSGNEDMVVGATAGQELLFYENNVEAARISGGNLLVGGTTTPAASSGAFVELNGNDGNCISTRRTSTSGRSHHVFFNPNGLVGSIQTNGSATAYNTSSDARLKDITGEARGLEVINELNPVAYNWKADGQADEGLIAQEVLDIVPNAVSGSEEEMYQMDYSKLVTPLIKAVQELSAEVEELKKQLENK